MNGKEMQTFAAEAPRCSILVTGSLFLLREFMLSERTDIMYINVVFSLGVGEPQLNLAANPDSISCLETLDRELEQADRFMEASATSW